MSRLNTERQKDLEPKRLAYAKIKIEELGFTVEEIGRGLVFMFNGNRITFWAYSGWHTEKGIKDGRGLDNLLKQLKRSK